MRYPIARHAAWYVGVAVTTVAVLVVLLKLWKASLGIPFNYAGDTLLYLAWVQSAVENGWYLTNPRLGAPFIQETHDFPLVDSLHFGLIKLLAAAGLGPVGAYNVYYLLGYPLAAMSALFALRRLGVSPLPASCLALLYAFLPYHFARGVGHLFLASYYLVPIQALMVVRVYQGEALVRPRPDSLWKVGRQPAALILCWVLFCLASASAGVYYAFFTCYFLLLAGVAGALRRRSLAPGLAAGLLVAAVTLGVVANVAPTLRYQAENGPNPKAVVRHPGGAEVYALKGTHLLLPMPGHRVSRLANLRRWYDSYAPVTEAMTSSLGVFGAAAFVALLVRFLARRFLSSPPDLNDFLGYLLLGGVALAAMGWFGSLFALLVSDHIRGYNRISVFLSFFAFAGLGLFLTWLQGHLTTHPRRLAFGAAVAAVLLVGLYDQSSPAYLPRYAAAAEAWGRDREFFAQVEESLPAGAMVFQYPPHIYPEAPPVNGRNPYELLAGVIHTRTARWSYGAVKGRYGYHWQQELPLEARPYADRLALAGFDAVCVDLALCNAEQRPFVEKLAGVLNVAPLRSADGRHLVYSLAPHREALRYSEADRELVLSQVIPLWEDGFSDFESDASMSWRWCAKRGSLVFLNPSPSPREVEVSFVVEAPGSPTSTLRLGGLLTETVPLTSAPAALKRTVKVPPGRHAVTFSCDARRLVAPGDDRLLVFRLVDFKLRDGLSPAAPGTTRASR